MIRWTAAAVLLAAALATGWLAHTKASPRGVTLRIFDNLRWEGPPAQERISRHADFAPGLRRNPIDLPDRSSVRMDAWLFAPRTGGYEFGVESNDDAWLRIDQKTVLTHRRGLEESVAKVHLQKGFHTFRVQVRHRTGEANLFLKWRLPSGYMKLEALPPVFLHPERPRAGEGVPFPLRLTPILLALLALITLLLPRIATGLRRLRTDAGFRLRVAAGFFLFATALGMRAWDLDGAGETSDEWAYCGAGRIYVSNIGHGYFESVYWNTNEEHPPIGKYVYGLVSHLTGTDSYTPLRATSAVFGALVVLLTFLFGARFFSPFVGLLAGLILAFLPPFIAHTKVAALDSPSAFIYTLGAYLFIRAMFAQGSKNRWFLLAGLVACLAFATKFSNATLFVFMVAVHLAGEWRNVRRRGIIELPVPLYILPFLPMLVLLIVWPWLWREPFGQFVTTLRHWDYPIKEWFMGRYRQLPPYYFPMAFLATTPSLLLLPFAGFFTEAWRKRSFLHLVVLFWFLAPFLWTISVLKQDGIRYIYTMYPPLAIMIAVGFQPLIRLRARVMRPVVLLTTGLYLFWQSWTVHPYYLDYYSELFGGPKTVWTRSLFEVGWWGEGMDRAYDYINQNAAPGATWDLRAVVTHTADSLRPDLVNDTTSPDWLVKANITPDEQMVDGYEEQFRVEVDAAPIVLVYLRADLGSQRDPSAPPRPLPSP